jgi:hypothetical protein
VSLLTAEGKPPVPESKDEGPWTANYAFVLGTREDGSVQIVDHDHVLDVRSRRVATLDDMYAAAGLAWSREAFPGEPQETPYVTAFLVFQLPEGPIVASPDVFHNIMTLIDPTSLQVRGACDVLRGQIVAQKAADMAAPLAIQAALSGLGAMAKAEAEHKINAQAQKLISKTRNG